MSREEWIGAGVVFLLACALLVVAVLVKAWHTDPEDVIRRTEQRRDQEVMELARVFAGEIDLTNRHFDWRRANELTIELPRRGVARGEPTVQVNVRRDEEEPWGWAK